MDILIDRPEFRQHPLTVRTSSFWRGPMLLQDGEAIVGVRRVFSAKGVDGATVAVKLRPKLFDTVPGVTIGGREVSLAPPLLWYEYALISLPIALIFIGGAMGGFIGYLATNFSAAIMRSHRPPLVRYALSILVVAGAAAVYSAALALALTVRKHA